MTTLEYDFDGANGTLPSGWSDLSGGSSDASIQSNELRLTSVPSSSAVAVLDCGLGLGSVIDEWWVEGTFEVVANTFSYFEVILLSDATGAESFGLAFLPNDDSVRLYYYADPTTTALDTDTMTGLGNGSIVRFKFHFQYAASGGQIDVYTWFDGDTEPGTPNLTYAGNTTLAAAETDLLGAFAYTSSGTVEHDIQRYYVSDTGFSGAASAPAAITDLAGTAGDTQVALTHSAPDDGGSAITDYNYEFRAAGFDEPVFVAAGTQGNGTAGVSPGLPAGIVTGDLLLLHIEGEGEDVNADGAPAGWTLVGTVASATSSETDRTRHTVYWTAYDSGSPPSTSVPDAGDHTLAVITAWRNVDTSNPFVAVQTSSSGTNATSHTATGVTNTVNRAMIVASVSHGDDAATAGQPCINADAFTATSPSTLADAARVGTSSGSDGTIGVAYGIQATAAATGSIAWNSTVSEERAAIVMALRPLSPLAGSWTSFSDGTSTTPGATVTGLSNGTAYEFRARAVNAIGNADWSNIAGPYTPASAGPVTEVVDTTAAATTDVLDVAHRVEVADTTVAATTDIVDVRTLVDVADTTVTATTDVLDALKLLEVVDTVIAAATDTTDTASRVDTADTTIAAATDVLDTASRVDVADTAIAATTDVVDLAARLDTLDTAIAATTDVTDARSLVDLADTAIAATADTVDVQTWVDPVDTVIAATTDVVDTGAGGELVDTVITGTTDVLDVAARLDVVDTTVTATADTVDAQSFVDLADTVIAAATDVLDAAALVEVVDSVVAAITDVLDVGAFLDVVETTIVASTDVVEGGAMFELVDTVVTASTEVLDLRRLIDVADHVFVATTDALDAQAYAELVDTAIAASTDTLDVQTWVDVLESVITAVTDVLDVGRFVDLLDTVIIATTSTEDGTDVVFRFGPLRVEVLTRPREVGEVRRRRAAVATIRPRTVIERRTR